MSFFGDLQCLPVDDCSAVSCDSGALARGSECMSFYFAILNQSPDLSFMEILGEVNVSLNVCFLLPSFGAIKNIICFSTILSMMTVSRVEWVYNYVNFLR